MVSNAHNSLIITRKNVKNKIRIKEKFTARIVPTGSLARPSEQSPGSFQYPHCCQTPGRQHRLPPHGETLQHPEMVSLISTAHVIKGVKTYMNSRVDIPSALSQIIALLSHVGPSALGSTCSGRMGASTTDIRRLSGLVTDATTGLSRIIARSRRGVVPSHIRVIPRGGIRDTGGTTSGTGRGAMRVSTSHGSVGLRSRRRRGLLVCRLGVHAGIELV